MILSVLDIIKNCTVRICYFLESSICGVFFYFTAGRGKYCVLKQFRVFAIFMLVNAVWCFRFSQLPRFVIKIFFARVFYRNAFGFFSVGILFYLSFFRYFYFAFYHQIIRVYHIFIKHIRIFFGIFDTRYTPFLNIVLFAQEDLYNAFK